MIGTDETSFPRNLLLTDRYVVNFCKALANSSPKDTKLSKTEILKIIKSVRFLDCGIVIFQISWAINESWVNESCH